MSSLTITSVSLVILRRRRLRPLFREPGNVPRQANAVDSIKDILLFQVLDQDIVV
jgi:hypothetical protein